MTNIGDTTYTANIKMQNAFFYFSIRYPYTVSGVITTETATFTGMSVDRFYAGNSIGSGRLFYFTYGTGTATGTSAQVSFVNSQFQNIYSDTTGAWAYMNLYKIWVSISGVGTGGYTFQNIVGRYYGGSTG